MGLIKIAMASTLGIGGTKVDAIINTTYTYPGGIVEGVIQILGGDVEQDISGVMLEINTTYDKGTGVKSDTIVESIQKITIPINRTIHEHENVEVPFSFILSTNCPVTTNRSPIWIASQLEIDRAIDSKDKDYITVQNTDEMNNVITAIENLGFRAREINNIASKSKIAYYNFLQRFQFVTVDGVFRGEIDELEVVFFKDNYGLTIYLYINRGARQGVLDKAFGDEEDTQIKIEFTQAELEDCDTISQIIEDMINRGV